MSTIYEWQDFGDNYQDWNKADNNDRYSEHGHGEYFPVHNKNTMGYETINVKDGENDDFFRPKKVFIPAYPILVERFIVSPDREYYYYRNVEEVFEFRFVLPNGKTTTKR